MKNKKLPGFIQRQFLYALASIKSASCESEPSEHNKALLQSSQLLTYAKGFFFCYIACHIIMVLKFSLGVGFERVFIFSVTLDTQERMTNVNQYN
jgi:hypothetical protein